MGRVLELQLDVDADKSRASAAHDWRTPVDIRFFVVVCTGIGVSFCLIFLGHLLSTTSVNEESSFFFWHSSTLPDRNMRRQHTDEA